MQSHPTPRLSFYLFLFLLTIAGVGLLKFALFLLPVSQHAPPSDLFTEQSTALSPFAYFKGAWKLVSNASAPVCPVPHLQSFLDILRAPRGNLLLDALRTFQSNTTRFTETSLRLSGALDVEFYAACDANDGVFSVPTLSISPANGTVSLLRCYLVLTNWLGMKHNDLRDSLLPALSALPELTDNVSSIPPYKRLPTMLLVVPQNGRAAVLGTLHDGHHASLRLKGLGYEQQAQTNQILILLNVFLLVFFVQSWIVLFQNNMAQPRWSFVDFSLQPF